MEELKSCLFCGRYIDKSFAYCPYCGFEFGQRGDASEYPEETPDLSSVVSLAPEEGDGIPGSARASDYIARLRDMQNLLSDMERELDLILSNAGSAPRQDRGEAKIRLSGHGQVTSFSKGP
jgi:hypothetical protein